MSTIIPIYEWKIQHFSTTIYEYCQQQTNSVHIFVFIFSWHLRDGITTQLYTAHGGLGTRRPVFSAYLYMYHHIIAASRADANKIFQFENRRDLRKNRLERDTHFRERNLTIIIFVACRDLFPRDRQLRRNIASVGGLSDRVLEFNITCTEWYSSSTRSPFLSFNKSAEHSDSSSDFLEYIFVEKYAREMPPPRPRACCLCTAVQQVMLLLYF